MIENNTQNKLYNEFEELYGKKAIAICPLLSEFNILVYTKEQYEIAEVKEKLPEIEWDGSPLAFSLNKPDGDASLTLAVIVVDENCCELLELTNEEIMASTAHEVGHIIFFFLTNKAIYDKFGEEIIADEFATRIGLGKHLKSALAKLKSSDLYSEGQRDLMRIRIQRIDFEMNHALFVDETT
jgi:hypothetical protein